MQSRHPKISVRRLLGVLFLGSLWLVAGSYSFNSLAGRIGESEKSFSLPVLANWYSEVLSYTRQENKECDRHFM
jgi:hypothetical protein